jgi:antitoxin component of MazEF toxin-antitoxin module
MKGTESPEVNKKAYDPHALLKGITPKNQHQAADFGPALGEEVW